MLDVSAGRGKFTHCIRLVIADPQPIVLQGLKSIFAAQHDFEIVALCDCGTSCLEAIRNLAPDVALVAGTLPDLTVSGILAIAKAEKLRTRLMFFAEPEGDDDLTAAITAGTCNAVSTYADPDTILRSLRLMTEGIGALPSRDLSPNDTDSAKIEKMLQALTHRERQIVQLVTEGLSNKEIARELNVSRGTVKVHLYNIFQKLEINNRTVLATIALLQRSNGFTTLSLTLALAILSDIDPSDARDALPDEAAAAPKDIEHPGLELWKKPILRHTFAADPDSAVALAQKGFFTKDSQVTHPAARMEGLAAAGQAVLSNHGRSHPIGSSAPSAFISPLLQALDSQTGEFTAQQPFPPPALASNPIRSHGGYALIALTAAGMGLNTLDNSHAAAQPLEPGETPIGASAVAIEHGATQVAMSNSDVVDKADLAAAANLASESAVHGLHPSLGGSGNDTIEVSRGDDTAHDGTSGDIVNGGNGNDAVVGGVGGDKLAGGHGDDNLVYRSTADSKSSRLDTINDLTLGPDRINLAAFGALAFLQLTSVNQSIPPHTLAWIYNPVSNETIVYVNATDRSLDIGDAGLLEVHLQGVVSAAEVESTGHPDAAAVEAALHGIDPELLVAVASDGTVLTSDGVDASIDGGSEESTLTMAGAWRMRAEDSFRFHFGRDRTDSSVSTRLASFDHSDDGAEARDVAAVNIPVHISPIELAYSHPTALTEENPGSKKGWVYANIGNETIGHGNPHANAGFLFDSTMQSDEIVPPVVVEEISEPGNATGNGRGHDNAQHASQGAKGSNAADLAEGDPSNNGVAHGKSEHASKSATGEAPPAAALNGAEDAPGLGNSQHPANPKSAKTSLDVEPTEPADKPGRGNSGHASKSADEGGSQAALNGPDDAPGDGNSQHPANPKSTKTSSDVEPTEPAGKPGRGNSEHASKSGAEEAPSAAALNGPDDVPGHGNSQHPAQPNSAKTSSDVKPTEPADKAGRGNSEHASKSGAEEAPPAAALNGPNDLPSHGNSQHPPHPGSAKMASDAEPAEPAGKPGNGKPAHTPHSASEKVSVADNSAEPDVTPGNAVHDNSHASHPLSVNAIEPAAPAEPDTAPGNGGNHGNSKNASKTAAEQTSAATGLTEPSDPPGHGNSKPPAGASEPPGGGHGNSSQASHTAPADLSAATPEPTESAPGTGAGSELSFVFKNQAPSSTPTGVADLAELFDPPGHGAELRAILETDPPTPEVHGNSHAQGGQHHALAHLTHDLLP